MNIHFTNKKDFNYLKKKSILNCAIGSQIYNLENEDSDKDYLFLYAEKTPNLIWSHHQLQFKENNVDFIFTSVSNFFRNIITGDSTINFELLFSSQFIEHPYFSFLENNQTHFYNYKIAKSYLGLVKRDLANYLKANDIKIKLKLAKHILRGLDLAKNIINKQDICLDYGYLKETDCFSEVESLIRNNVIIKMRDDLNSLLNAQSIPFSIDLDFLALLNSKVVDINSKFGIKLSDKASLFKDILKSQIYGVKY